MSIAQFLQAWRRRWWRADAASLAAFAHLTPTVVITGASEGIGAAFAHTFARSGQDVLLIARDGSSLDAVAATIMNDGAKAKVMTLALDITLPDAIEGIDRKLADRGAYADILVNSAGMGLAGSFATADTSEIDALVAVNVAALTRLCRYVLPGQLVRGRGGIINVASIGAYVPGPQQAAYYASKAYVLSLTEALAEETSGKGVRVMAVVPGAVETRFHAKMGANDAFYRMLIPAMRADRVASRTVLAFALGQRMFIPRLFDVLLVAALRILPHRVTMPIVGHLLRPRPSRRRKSDAI